MYYKFITHTHGFQNGNFQFIGRYKSGPFNFNVSKKGFSSSVQNRRGSYNILKPNYSSFKMAGVQIRGKTLNNRAKETK